MLLLVLPLFVFFKGVLMGLAIAAPVGPIALLCIRRTLAQGRTIGLLTGLGAATADGLYGMVAAFGLVALSNFLVDNTSILRLLGGLFLCYLGISMFLAKSTLDAEAFHASPLTSNSPLPSPLPSPLGSPIVPQIVPQIGPSRGLVAYGSTLLLTLTNPATIFSFIAIFAGLGLTQSNTFSALLLVLGVFVGSALWWLILVSVVSYLRQRLTPARLVRFNRRSTKVFGGLIFSFGVVALMTLVRV